MTFAATWIAQELEPDAVWKTVEPVVLRLTFGSRVRQLLLTETTSTTTVSSWNRRCWITRPTNGS